MTQLTQLIKSATNAQLVQLHNRFNPESPVKRFPNRTSGEKRVAKVLRTIDIGTLLPAPPPTGNGAALALAPAPVKSKPVKISHLNLRCEKCGYYAKTTPENLKKARLKCPVDGSLLRTKEERGETRGRN